MVERLVLTKCQRDVALEKGVFEKCMLHAIRTSPFE